jgi:hypothetical protein
MTAFAQTLAIVVGHVVVGSLIVWASHKFMDRGSELLDIVQELRGAGLGIIVYSMWPIFLAIVLASGFRKLAHCFDPFALYDTALEYIKTLIP